MYVLRKLCEDALLDEFELLRPLATWHLALKWVVVLALLSTQSHKPSTPPKMDKRLVEVFQLFIFSKSHISRIFF